MRRASRRRRGADIVGHEGGCGLQRASARIYLQSRLDPVQDRTQHREGGEGGVDVDADDDVGGVGRCGGEGEFRGFLCVCFSWLVPYWADLLLLVPAYASCLPARGMYCPGSTWCEPTFTPRTLAGLSTSDRALLTDILIYYPYR